ncbi:MAG TPA: RNA polymerase sigma factor RpoD/SigA [Bacteroidales bacterium]|nr:RNA polymerase sigma factor RpoD/SigA [Bacteroidales bacterium]
MRQLKIAKQVTNRETASLDKYLQEISKEALITPDDEVFLAQRIKQGDQAALHKLTRANLRFVVSVAKQYQNQGLSLPDLINEGNVGLIKAARRFDETKGFKFISYAVWWIRQSILQAIAEQSRIVRLPLNKIGTLNRINRTYNLFEQTHQREPNPDEIAEILNVSESEVRESMKNSGKHVSMDVPVAPEEETTMLDLMKTDELYDPETGLILDSLRVEIERAFSTITSREAEILRYTYGLKGSIPLTLDEIADKFDLTRERVRQIREKAIRKLKISSRSKNLKSYLG